MATVINNPGNAEGSSGVVSMFIGLIVLALALVLFFLYGLPMIRNSGAPAQEAPKNDSLDINVSLPKTEEPKEEPTP